VKVYFTVFAVTIVILSLALPAFSQQQRLNSERGFLAGKTFDLKAPAPRLANGKPDFSGLWDRPRVQDITRAVQPVGGITFKGEPELPFTPAGKRTWDSHDARNDYAGACLPYGFPRAIVAIHPMQLVQTNDHLAFLFEQNGWFTVVPIDGRPMPKDAADQLSWFGTSVGRWEGDTLVIETTALNGMTKLDTVGHPISTKTKLTQRLSRPNFGTMNYEMIVDDPHTYSRPLRIQHTWVLKPEWEIMEYSCMENQLDLFQNGTITWKRPERID
jgi:hypothetical protein